MPITWKSTTIDQAPSDSPLTPDNQATGDRYCPEWDTGCDPSWDLARSPNCALRRGGRGPDPERVCRVHLCIVG